MGVAGLFSMMMLYSSNSSRQITGGFGLTANRKRTCADKEPVNPMNIHRMKTSLKPAAGMVGFLCMNNTQNYYNRQWATC